MVGLYECICQEGYESEDGGWNCGDRDECFVNDICYVNVICLNMDGFFFCECKFGFIGNGVINCFDVDECFFKIVNCIYNFFCENIVGSYICICLEGFQ